MCSWKMFRATKRSGAFQRCVISRSTRSKSACGQCGDLRSTNWSRLLRQWRSRREAWAAVGTHIAFADECDRWRIEQRP
jgi:hypothetical protein